MIKLDKRPMDYSIRVIDGGYSQMIGSFGRLRYKGGERDLIEPDPWFNVSTTSMPWFGYNAWPVLQTTMLDKDNLVPWPPKVPARHSDEMHLLQLGKANSTWEFTLGGKKKYPSDRSAYKPLLYNLDSPEANDDDLVIRTKNGSWVDIVLQVGQDPMWPVDFPHPIHKHANKYWRIGSGDGIWTYSSVDEAIAAQPENFNLETPPYRDTFLTDFQGAMWVVLRYQVTTPGAWLLHCHIELHLDNGMAMAILDGVDAWPDVPEEYSSGAMGFRTGDHPAVELHDIKTIDPPACKAGLLSRLRSVFGRPFWQALGWSALVMLAVSAAVLAWRWAKSEDDGGRAYAPIVVTSPEFKKGLGIVAWVERSSLEKSVP